MESLALQAAFGSQRETRCPRGKVWFPKVIGWWGASHADPPLLMVRWLCYSFMGYSFHKWGYPNSWMVYLLENPKTDDFLHINHAYPCISMQQCLAMPAHSFSHDFAMIIQWSVCKMASRWVWPVFNVHGSVVVGCWQKISVIIIHVNPDEILQPQAEYPWILGSHEYIYICIP